MHYKKNVVHEFKLPVSEKTLRWGMAAAAAVVIAAVLPVTISNASEANSNTPNVASITPVARPQNSPIAARQNVVINGNLNGRMAQTVSTRSNSYSTLTDVDVIRPEFDETRKIQLNITVPGLNDENQTFEINLPVNSYEGSLEWNRHHR